MINLFPHDELSRNRLSPDRRGRLRRRCRARIQWLEDRTLLAAAADVLAGVAIPMALGTDPSGTLAPGEVAFYQLNAPAEGMLVAQVHAPGGTTRLTLLNGQHQVVMQSDAQAADNPDPLIRVDIPAGLEYLEVENLGGPTAYFLTASLTATTTPFQPISISTNAQPDGVATADFNGDGQPDLAITDLAVGAVEILLGNSDGGFHNAGTYAVGSGPGPIVAGDFNGDGRPDLAVAYGNSTVSVLLGNGDGSFQSPVNYTVGNGVVALTTGDFDGDGKLDLATANEADGDVSVLLGNGDGTFQNQVTSPAGNSPNALASGDFNGDGRTDLAVANFSDSTVSVLLGKGDGTFQDPAAYPVGSAPFAVVTGDFKGNGRADIATANIGAANVSVLLANPDGTFQTAVNYAVGGSPGALVTGDFNADGALDIAVANGGDRDVSVLLGNGDGTFQIQQTYMVGNEPDALVAADFDGDGTTDLAVTNFAANSVSTLLGNGDGSFQEELTYNLGTDPDAIAAGDFNGDGLSDLAVANLGAGLVTVLLGNGDGTFQFEANYAVGNNPIDIVTGDFNGDGMTDLAVADNGSDAVSILLGNGDGTFQPALNYAVGHNPEAVRTADFSGGGRTDLAVANLGSNTVSVLLGNGDGTFQPQVAYAVGLLPFALATGDFNGDGRPDLAVANQGSDTVSVLLGNGNGTFQGQVTYPVGNQPTALVAADFNGDGRTDLAVANFGFNDVSVLLGNGDGTFKSQVTYPVGMGPSFLVAADFNGDGHTDLAVTNDDTDDVSILLGNGDGTFKTQVSYPVGTIPQYLVAADLNGDGRLDLVTANTSSGDVSVLLGNGDGTFQSPTSIAAGIKPRGIVAADFNSDGRTDLAVANSRSNDVSVLLGNGDGTFQKQATYAVGLGPVALVAGDFNGDGRTDLAVADQGSDAVSVLLGNGDGTFQKPATYPVESNPIALVTADFSGDGRPDLAVADFGANMVSVLLGNGDGTFGQPVDTPVGLLPFALVAGDFNGDGHADLAVANAGNNNISVLLGNGDGTFKKRVNYDVGTLPAAVVSGDFNTDGRPDLAVANLGSGDVSVFLGNGDGTFQTQQTYAAGTAPDAIVIGDYDGDGRPDLAVANDINNAVSVLLGNGDGTFRTPATYPVGTGPVALAGGDFNGDGHTDFATANLSSNDVSVLLNLGGTFASAGAFVTTPQATPLVADLSGDGVADVFVVDSAGDILWRKGRPEEPGTFDPPVRINPGRPARDIVAVDTNLGPVLASVDSTDNAVSLYAFQNGSFSLVASLATGLLPAQIVTGGLTGDGLSDLVVRNAGDGTLSVFLNNGDDSGPSSGPRIPFQAALTLPVGLGVSDVTLADVAAGGRPDILLTNKLTGEVDVIQNFGFGIFGPAARYRAGAGAYQVTSAADTAPLMTLEATAGVAAGTFTAGAPADLLAINPGTNTASLLSGLGAGRLANAATHPTASPANALRVADLEGNGIPDAVILSLSGVTVDRGDGKGGFLPNPKTFDAGPNPTGLTIADVNHDGKPDLLVSNIYGDLLVLLGNGDGTFHPGISADQNVALAVLPNGSPTPDFIFADQGLDRVVVQGQPKPLADRSSGLLAPGAVVLADLNGDGIPDLIVADSGSNNVLVYPGLGNGQFGPELNGGHGFFTGTNPVGITAVKIHDDGSNDNHLDLVIANTGSNDVSILFYQPTANGGFTFTSGPRLQAGTGPTSTVVKDVTGDGIPDLLVSDSGSNDVRLLPGTGNGFFVDAGPQVKSFALPAGSTPVQVMVGTFLPSQGPEILTVDRGSNELTVISTFDTPTPVFNTIVTGGTDPVDAIAVSVAGQALESLIVANSGDGLFTLLGGTEGLQEEATLSNRELPEPTALDLATVSGDEVSFYAATAGVEAAFTLSFILPGFTPSSGPVPGSSSATAEAPAQLVALTETSLALVGTLLTTMFSTSTSTTLTVLTTATSAALSNPSENLAEVSTAFLSVSPSQGQSLFTRLRAEASGSGEVPETEQEAHEGESAPPWSRYVLGVDELLEQIRQESQDAFFHDGKDEPAKTDEGPHDDLFGAGLQTSPRARPQVSPLGFSHEAGIPARRELTRRGQRPAPNSAPRESLQIGNALPADRHDAQAVDEAIEALCALPQFRSVDSPSAEPPQDPALVWTSLLCSTMIIVRTNPPGLPRRDTRKRAGGRARARSGTNALPPTTE
jgi:hypothetical protein